MSSTWRPMALLALQGCGLPVSPSSPGQAAETISSPELAPAPTRSVLACSEEGVLWRQVGGAVLLPWSGGAGRSLAQGRLDGVAGLPDGRWATVGPGPAGTAVQLFHADGTLAAQIPLSLGQAVGQVLAVEGALWLVAGREATRWPLRPVSGDIYLPDARVSLASSQGATVALAPEGGLAELSGGKLRIHRVGVEPVERILPDGPGRIAGDGEALWSVPLRGPILRLDGSESVVQPEGAVVAAAAAGGSLAPVAVDTEGAWTLRVQGRLAWEASLPAGDQEIWREAESRVVCLSPSGAHAAVLGTTGLSAWRQGVLLWALPRG